MRKTNLVVTCSSHCKIARVSDFFKGPTCQRCERRKFPSPNAGAHKQSVEVEGKDRVAARRLSCICDAERSDEVIVAECLLAQSRTSSKALHTLPPLSSLPSFLLNVCFSHDLYDPLRTPAAAYPTLLSAASPCSSTPAIPLQRPILDLHKPRYSDRLWDFFEMSEPSTMAPRTQTSSTGPRTATTVQTTPQPVLRLSAPSGTLRLRAQPAEERHIQWAEDVIDNEGMGKKSSKGISLPMLPTTWCKR